MGEYERPRSWSGKPVQLLRLGLVREQGVSRVSRSNGQVVVRSAETVVVHGKQRHAGEAFWELGGDR